VADATARPVGPVALAAAAATLYTVPGSTTFTILAIHVANETGTARTFTLSIGTDAAGKRLYKDVEVAANGVLTHDTNIAVATGEIIQGFASAASALTITISGVLTT
jgi:hypothetical protein